MLNVNPLPRTFGFATRPLEWELYCEAHLQTVQALAHLKHNQDEEQDQLSGNRERQKTKDKTKDKRQTKHKDRENIPGLRTSGMVWKNSFRSCIQNTNWPDNHSPMFRMKCWWRGGIYQLNCKERHHPLIVKQNVCFSRTHCNNGVLVPGLRNDLKRPMSSCANQLILCSTQFYFLGFSTIFQRGAGYQTN